MSVLKVFVSFASNDRSFVQRLFYRLQAQPMVLWDYSREGQEIPGGSDVMRYLEEQIARCDVFIPVISRHCFESNYAKGEVRFALQRRCAGQLRIIPLLHAHCPAERTWPEPYRELAGVCFYKVKTIFTSPEERPEIRASLEEALRRLCGDLGLAYRPLPIEDPRLPFMDKFEEEMRQAESRGRSLRHKEHQIAIYQRLMDARNEVGEALSDGDYGAALVRINYFVATCEYELPEERFYYPYVVKAICLISGGLLLPARDVLLGLMGHPLLDENVFAALGYINHQQGAYAEAMGCYSRAAQIDPHDPAAKHGLLLNALLSSTRVDVDELLRGIERGDILAPSDRLKVNSLKAFAYAAAGRPDDAVRVYEQMISERQTNPAMLVNFAHVLCSTGVGQPARALALLDRYEEEFGLDANYLHRMASLNFQLGRTERAGTLFRRLVAAHPDERQYRIDAAQVFWQGGDHDTARALAACVLDRRLFRLPATSNDFFCEGFANWLLGRHERADYDFERSGRPIQDHYRHLLP